MADTPMPERKPLYPGNYRVDGQRPTIVFVTMCTLERRPWLASRQVHLLLRAVWLCSVAWRVGRYVIMPDHVHFFCSPWSPETSLKSWSVFWRRQLGRAHGNEHCRWQPGMWDTRLRAHESYEEKWTYVQQNPVRHGLVSTSEEWPHQGEIYRLEWW